MYRVSLAVNTLEQEIKNIKYRIENRSGALDQSQEELNNDHKRRASLVIQRAMRAKASASSALAA